LTPLSELSELADESLSANESSQFESSQFNKSFQFHQSSQFDHSNGSCLNETPLSNELLLNESVDPPGGQDGQGGNPEVAGRCKRGGRAKRSQASQKKGDMREFDEFQELDTAGDQVVERRFEVTQAEALPEDQALGWKGNLFLSCVSSYCRIVQSGTSDTADFDLSAARHILQRVVTPGHSPINPYRVSLASAPAEVRTATELERWYEWETLKGFLDVCMDLENKESILHFSYMISAIQFVSKIVACVPFSVVGLLSIEY
jgi:hypothetical protein